MIPLWAKDKTGKWQVFPTHLLETLRDGSMGFKFDWAVDNTERRKYFAQFRQYFEANPVGWGSPRSHYYRLVKQPTNE